jgi:glycosyltransferase involved in cell wall biosynthesis
VSCDARRKISVIVPAFGRQVSLKRAIASAIAELAIDDEVLVIDDGSAPPIDLSEELAADPRLRLIRSNENRGAAAARNLGISHARRDLIAFLDSDDRWLPGKIDAQIDALAEAQAEGLIAVSCGWIDSKSGSPIRTRIPRPSRTRQDFFAGNWFAPGTTLLISRAAFDVCGSFREDLPRLEDYEWFIRFALAGGRLVAAPIIGAEIAAGNNARPDAVNAAAAKIWRLHGRDTRLRLIERRKMTAFLALVQAVGARNGGLWARFGFHLARSFLKSPRLSVHLDDWWPGTRAKASS